MKYLILLFSIQVFGQIPASDRGREFEQVTGIKLGHYKLKKGDKNACRGGSLHVVDLENRFTLAIGQMALVYSLGTEEVAFEEEGCKTVDRSSYKKDEVRQHTETTCPGEPVKILDTVVLKTKKGFKYNRKLTQAGQVIVDEKCELHFQDK